MARPPRIEFPGALYHLTARGNAQAAIFLDDLDLSEFLSILGDIVERSNWICHAQCLIGNHCHLLIETLEGEEPFLKRLLPYLKEKTALTEIPRV